MIFGACILLFFIALYMIMDLGSRRSTERSVMLSLLGAPSYLIAILFSLAAFLPLFRPPVWLFLLIAGGFLPVFAILLARVLAQPSDAPREVTSDRCWHGNFYYNPDDPALFVEARIGFGYAMNFRPPPVLARHRDHSSIHLRNAACRSPSPRLTANRQKPIANG